MKKIAINIASKDRATEVGLLLESLRHQTYKNFDIFILDDGSNVPLQNFYFINYIIQRLKLEGHDVKFFRNDIPSGVSKARQLLVDKTMKYNYDYICRIDDDSICKEDMLEKLLEGVNAGYDLVGCIVPLFTGPEIIRDIKFVEPVINGCRLDDKGNLTINMDDCGYEYTEEKILPAHHFRSSCLYKTELHKKGVDYSNRLSKHGFREEQIFSFKAILKGFKLGVHTGAICYHLNTPSGGERSTSDMTQFNQEIFEKTTKKMFEDNGDFIEQYNKRNNIVKRRYHPDELKKATNLVSRK